MKRDGAGANGTSAAAAKKAKSENFGVGGRPQPTLGAPRSRPVSQTFVTAGSVVVITEVTDVEDPVAAVKELSAKLDRSRGCLLSSSYEYPGRYAQWTLGFANPPICLESWSRKFKVRALNCRGMPFLPVLFDAIAASSAVKDVKMVGADCIEGEVKEPEGFFSEEERSKQPSIFSVIRVVKDVFASDEDPNLGLYGAFGYDLAFQFEKVKLHQKREAEQRDLVLYIPDEL
ncbi:unnamed protein product, partial [Polarella glacialis]